MSKEEILREKTSYLYIFADGTEKELTELREKIYSAMESYASQESISAHNKAIDKAIEKIYVEVDDLGDKWSDIKKVLKSLKITVDKV